MPLYISLKVALIATLLTAVIGVPLAYGVGAINRRAKLVIDAVILLPLVLPPTVIGFVLLWLFGSWGPLSLLPFDVVFTWWAAVVTATVVALPLAYRSAQAAFEQIDHQLLDVARTLGASEWRIFYRVVLPLARPGIFSGVLLSFARALGEFGATLMLAGNIPGKTQTLPMAVYFAVEGGDFATATRWSVVMGAIALVTVALSDFVRQPRKQPRLRKLRKPIVDSALKQEEKQEEQKVLTSPLALTVDITKQLGRFNLRVQFFSESSLVGVLGASGAGKSLLLRCLAGIEKPDAGRIVLGDRILYDSNRGIDIPSSDRAISLLFQNYALFPHLTVAENVAFGIWKHRECRQLVAKELAAVRLSDYANMYPEQLSGGQQQRVALARALASRPRLLLLDEPFAALDGYLRSQLSEQLFNRISSFTGSTFLVSHNFAEVYRSEQLLVMYEGEAMRYASPAEVFERPQKSAIAQLTGSINQSSIQREGDYLRATNWEMQLRIAPAEMARLPADPSLLHCYSVGIRPTDVFFITSNWCQSLHSISCSAANIATSAPANVHTEAVNQANCWPCAHRLSPASVMLWLKLHAPATHPTDYHLQATVDKSTWELLQQQSPPWTLYLSPQNVIVLSL